MIGKFFIYDALTLVIKTIEIGKDPDCPLCGPHPKITGLVADNSEACETGTCRIA